jgi:hypothetical protein
VRLHSFVGELAQFVVEVVIGVDGAGEVPGVDQDVGGQDRQQLREVQP